MSDVEHLIEDLEADGVQLRVVGDRLHYRARPGAFTDEHRRRLRASREDVLRVLRLRTRHGLSPPEITGAESVWLPTAAQVGAALSPIPILMRDIRRWRSIDLAACQAALNALIARHGILRTHYMKDAEGRLWAVTERERVLPIESVDLTAVEEPDRTRRLDELVRSRAEAAFDVWNGPLLRLTFVRLGPDETVSVLVVCHSVFDGYSQDIFTRDLLALYQAVTTGEPSGLEPLERQFRDFARMQNEWIESEDGQAHVLHLRERLLGTPRKFWIPADPEASASGDLPTLRGQFDGQGLERLRELVRVNRVTMCAAVLTAAGIALGRWAGSGDSFVWIVNAGRTDADFEALIGCCAVHTPFPMRFQADQTFHEALQMTWSTYLEDTRHAYPGQLLGPMIKRAHENGIFAGTELNFRRFDWFRYFDWKTPSTSGSLLEAREDQCARLRGPANRQDDISIFTLRLLFLEFEDRIEWAIRHRRGVFSEGTIERLSRLIASSFGRMAMNPEASVYPDGTVQKEA